MLTPEEIVNEVAKYIGQKERDEIPSKYYGDPKNKKYPARNQKEFDNAVRLAGRSKDVSAESVRRRLKQIAIRENYKLPKSWENK
jgi:hypothetical protein